MHNEQLEDRLRAVLRAEGDELFLTITPEELVRRLSLRRRERMSRRLGSAAAGVAVVLIGSLVAMSSGWFGAPTGGSVPSAPPSTPSPSETAGLDCAPVDPVTSNQPPVVGMGAWPGDSMAYAGQQGSYTWNDRHLFVDFLPNDDLWSLAPVPAGPPVRRLQLLDSSGQACLLVLRATATSETEDVDLRDSLTAGPSRVVEIAAPPAGDWIVAVELSFPSLSGTADMEMFFHVLVNASGPNDNSVLGPFPQLGSPPQTIFLDTLHEPSSPNEPVGSIETSVAGHVSPRAGYIVDVACLGPSRMRWSIGHEGQLDFLAAGDQTCDGTLSNGWIDRGTPNVPLDVIVKADPSTVWRIRVATNEAESAFIPPVLRAIEAGNTGGSEVAVEAFGRCAAPVEGSVPCHGEWFDLDGARVLRIPSQAGVTFGLEDAWLIDAARITAVRVDDLGENTFAPEHSVAFVDERGPLATVQIPLEPGSWIMRFALNGSRGGTAFDAHYDIRIEVE